MNWRSSLGLFVGGFQGFLLGLKIIGHTIESTRQDGDLFGIGFGIYARAEVSAGDAAGGLHEAAHGRRNRVGCTHAQPDGPHQHQQRRLGVAQREDRLDALAALGRSSRYAASEASASFRWSMMPFLDGPKPRKGMRPGRRTATGKPPASGLEESKAGTWI